ncbi:MAG: H-type lectin domain-containing protein [Acutalibacteraceae bacterium]|nr:H-type lectin domain-containing protein [Acutalibacteraceae bacterium]
MQDGTPTPDVPVDIVSVGDDGTVIITVDNGSDITLSAEITSGLPLCSIGDVHDELIYNADGTGKIIKRTAKKRVVADSSLHHNWQAGAWGINDFFADGVEISSFVDVANYYCNYATFNTGAHYIVSTAGLIGVAQGGGTNLYFRFSTEHTTYDAVANYLNNNNIYIVYQLATPQEIELSADEMAALAKLQTMDGITNVFNSDNAEMQITFLGGNEMQTNIDGFWDSEDGDKKYSAADFVGFFQDFFTNGIVAESTTYLQVLEKSGFEVAVNVGKAYINGCFFKPKTITTLTLEVNDGTTDRTDLIVIRWDKPLRQIYLAVKKGTTQLTRNELVYELGIAKIAVKASATEITQANISDLRFDNAYCGVVTGVIDTIDTTNLFAQYEAEWNNLVSQLGESDKIYVSAADEQARADLAVLTTSFEAFADKAVTTIGTEKLVLSGRTSTSETTVSFTKKFATTPNVAIAFAPSSISPGYIYSAHVSDVSTTSFKIGKRALYSSDASTVNGTVYWIAIGEEAAE